MLFNFEETGFKNLWRITPNSFEDSRGTFFRVFCKKEFQKIGFEKEFVQLNHSITNLKGTVRGMHFQQPPFAEVKLVRCIKGTILDVVVDIREGSPTFLQYFTVELSDKNKQMLLIPEGFAHGFQALEDNVEMLYHHTNFYTPVFESGLKYDDPKVKIDWILPPMHVSDRDKSFPLLEDNFKGIRIENE